jgi:hypothetical protein
MSSKIIYDPLIFANNSFFFFKIQSINSDRDGLCQNVKTDLAYTETKRNRI